MLSLTATQESHDYLASSVIPQNELTGGGGEITRVQLFQHRGAAKRRATQIEDEIHEGVELILLQSHCYDLIHVGCGTRDVAGEQGIGLILRDGEAGNYIAARVAVSNGPDSDLILISRQLASFELPGHRQACVAVAEVIDSHFSFSFDHTREPVTRAGASIARRFHAAHAFFCGRAPPRSDCCCKGESRLTQEKCGARWHFSRRLFFTSLKGGCDLYGFDSACIVLPVISLIKGSVDMTTIPAYSQGPEKYLVAFVIEGDDVFKITVDNVVQAANGAGSAAFEGVAKLKAAVALFQLTNVHNERPQELRKMARELAQEGMMLLARASAAPRLTTATPESSVA